MVESSHSDTFPHPKDSETSSISHSFSAFDTHDDLNSYFKSIQKYPFLQPDEEYELATDWVKKQDKVAAEKLVTSHLRLVARVAAGYKGYGLPLADLIAEGNLGILHALKKFDPTKGHRFSTYALWWIKAFIQEYILKSWSLVKIGTTGAQKKLFFNLRRLKKKIQEDDQEFSSLNDETIESIAKELGVEEEEVREMEKRLWGGDASLNSPVSQTGDTGEEEWQDWVESDRPTQEEAFLDKEQKKHEAQLLLEGFEALTPREISIIKSRRLKEPPDTLEIVAKDLHISKERVRQLEVSAFDKLRKHMREVAVKHGWTEE